MVNWICYRDLSRGTIQPSYFSWRRARPRVVWRVVGKAEGLCAMFWPWRAGKVSTSWVNLERDLFQRWPLWQTLLMERATRWGTRAVPQPPTPRWARGRFCFPVSVWVSFWGTCCVWALFCVGIISLIVMWLCCRCCLWSQEPEGQDEWRPRKTGRWPDSYPVCR